MRQNRTFAMRSSLLKAFSFSVMVAIAGSSDASAQATRAEQIASEQAEKNKRLAPEQAGAGEKFVVRVLSSPLLTGSGGVYPWFGSVFPGSGFAAGIGYLHRLPNKGGLSFTAAS